MSSHLARQRTIANLPRGPLGVRRPAWGALLTLVTLLLLLVSRPAAAALVFAPMCGTHAQSVVAPPISRAAPDIPLAPADCEDRRGTLLETSDHQPSPLPTPVLELTPRLAALAYRLPSSPCVLTPIASTRCVERLGHRSTLERPPRARLS